jgi:hypothetical protein
LAKIFIPIQFHLAAKVLAAWRGGKADCVGGGGDSFGDGKEERFGKEMEKEIRGFDMGFCQTKN